MKTQMKTNIALTSTFSLAVLMITILLCGLTHKEKKIRLFLAGDSTMSDKEVSSYPETGWGSRMSEMFDSTVTVINKAQNGLSTSTTISSGRWAQIATEIRAGDYVMLQFGQNDEVTTKQSYTNEKQFRTNLIFFIKSVKRKKAIPILLTPVARRRFDEQGEIIDTHPIYAGIIKNVAEVMTVKLIDVNKMSMSLLKKMGPEHSKLFFNYLLPGQNPNFPEGKKDDTHLNEYGARKIAQIVIAAIKEGGTDLQHRVIIGNQGIK